jgi:hypothetical protein
MESFEHEGAYRPHGKIKNLQGFVQEPQGRRICVISDAAGIQTVYVLICTRCRYKAM